MSGLAIWPGVLVLASVVMAGRDGRFLVLHGLICAACVLSCPAFGVAAALALCVLNIGFGAMLGRFAGQTLPVRAHHRAMLAAIVLGGAGLHAAHGIGQPGGAAIAAILAAIAGAALAPVALIGAASLLRALNAAIVLAVASRDWVAVLVAIGTWCGVALVVSLVLPRLGWVRPESAEGGL